MPEAATKADIDRLYDRLDPMAIDVAVIKSRMESLPEPRPCEYFVGLKKEVDTHIDEAKDATQTWKKSVIAALVSAAKMALIFLLASWVISLQG